MNGHDFVELKGVRAPSRLATLGRVAGGPAYPSQLSGVLVFDGGALLEKGGEVLDCNELRTALRPVVQSLLGPKRCFASGG
jgi:hypothetical protein